MSMFSYPFVLLTLLAMTPGAHLTQAMEDDLLLTLEEGTPEEKGSAARAVAAGYLPKVKCAKTLQQMLTDESTFCQLEIDGQPYDIQVRDAALVALLALDGEDYENFHLTRHEEALRFPAEFLVAGFETATSRDGQRISCQYYFRSAADRQAAFAQWNQQAEPHKLPQ